MNLHKNRLLNGTGTVGAILLSATLVKVWRAEEDGLKPRSRLSTVIIIYPGFESKITLESVIWNQKFGNILQSLPGTSFSESRCQYKSFQLIILADFRIAAYVLWFLCSPSFQGLCKKLFVVLFIWVLNVDLHWIIITQDEACCFQLNKYNMPSFLMKIIINILHLRTKDSICWLRWNRHIIQDDHQDFEFSVIPF